MGKRSRQRSHDVNVIADAADIVASGPKIATEGGEVAMHAVADFVIEEGIAIFGREDEVEVNV